MVKKNKKVVPIFFTFNERYVMPAAVTFYSLLENANKKYFYKLYVVQIEDNIKQKSKNKLIKIVSKFPNASLEFRKINFNFDDIWADTFKAHFSKEIFLKLVAGSIFLEYDKIIFSDVDVVFSGDISSLENYNINDYYIAGIQSLEKIDEFIELQRYTKDIKKNLKGSIGAGFLIYNLKKIRNNNIEKNFLLNLEKYKNIITQPEQDIINLTLPKEKILKLPLKYMFCTYMYRTIGVEKMNIQCKGKWLYYLKKSYLQYIKADKYHTKKEVMEAFTNPIQIHYATGTKPWNTLFCYRKFIWMKYLIKSAYFINHLFYFLKYMMTFSLTFPIKFFKRVVLRICRKIKVRFW